VPSQATLRRRGGLVRVRTKRLPDGRYLHVYVVPKKGPRGGRTLTGEPKRRKSAA